MSRSALASIALFWLAPTDLFAQTTIYVNEQSPTANPIACPISVDGPGSRPDLPGNSLLDALGCTLDPTYDRQAVAIVVVCSTSACSYDYSDSSGDGYVLRTSPDAKVAQSRRMLFGFPREAVKITKPFRVYGDNWTIEGIHFDGQWGDAGGTFVQITGSNVIFTSNRIENWQRNCLGVISGDSPIDPGYGQPENVTLSHNTVQNCRKLDPSNQNTDVHCIYTDNARNLSVKFNSMANCQGDGFQATNHLLGANQFPQYYSVAEYLQVVGNRISASCMDIGGGNYYTVGEDGIDLKTIGVGLRVADNLISGYKHTRMPSGGDCPGTGTDSSGAGIVLHGSLMKQYWNRSAPPVVKMDDPKDCPPELGGMCGVIEGNDITDTNSGMKIGSNSDTGAAKGIHVRGNYIHDLRGRPGIEDFANGLGIRLSTVEGRGDAPNKIYRNTLANLPGESIRIEEDSPYHDVADNSVAWSAGEALGPSGFGCSAPDPSQGFSTVTNMGWFHALATDGLAYTSKDDDPEFFKPWSQQFTPFGPYASSCGRQASPLPSGFAGSGEYDYRPVWSAGSALEDRGTGVFGPRYSEFDEYCGDSPDIGADEVCSPWRVLMLDEAYTHDGWEYWPRNSSYNSPDVGVNLYFPIELDVGDGHYPLNNWAVLPGQDASIHIRIRAEQLAEIENQPIQVRVFAAFGVANPKFPSDYRLAVDATVKWTTPNFYPAMGTDPVTGLTYHVHNGGFDHLGFAYRIFVFPWRVPGPYVFGLASAEVPSLQAEISTERDRRPQLFTAPWRSNNIAARRVITFPGCKICEFFPLFDRPLLINALDSATMDIRVEGRGSEQLRAIVFPPSPRPLGDGSEIPSEASEYPLQDGLNEVPVPPEGGWLQILATEIGTEGLKTKITIGDGELEVSARRNDFEESFEAGDLVAWERTGLWRPITRDLVDGTYCGRARTGRVAFGFNSSETCSFGGSGNELVSGRLFSPAITIPASSSRAGLTFAEHFDVPEEADSTVRRVLVETLPSSEHPDSETVIVFELSSPTNSSVEWTQRALELSSFAGRTIRVIFEFESMDDQASTEGHSGWYIDDVSIDWE